MEMYFRVIINDDVNWFHQI